MSGTVTRTGPDGVETVVHYDAANRATSVVRGPVASPYLMTTYTYYDNGLVDTVTNDNLSTIEYTYDDAQRLSSIEHRNGVGSRILMLSYAYTPHDLVSTITESDAGGTSAVTTFTYDDRGRLIHEVRVDYRQFMDSYDLAYEYDQGGNRTKRIDAKGLGTTIETVYTYDIEDPDTYLSKDNRLMKWVTTQYDQGGGQQSAASGGGPSVSSPSLFSGGGAAPAAPGGGGPTVTPLEMGWIYYANNSEYGDASNPRYDHGNAGRIVVADLTTDPDTFTSTRFVYAYNGRAVSYVQGETWHYFDDVYSSSPNAYYDITYAREFRYDGARQRYLDRELDPGDLMLSPPVLTPIGETWSDYDGDTIYGDFETWPSISTVRSYAPGMGRFDWSSGSPVASSVQK